MSRTLLGTWLSLLAVILDPLARRSCVPLLTLPENIIVPQLLFAAYCTVYYGGESARKAESISGRLNVTPTLNRATPIPT